MPGIHRTESGVSRSAGREKEETIPEAAIWTAEWLQLFRKNTFISEQSLFFLLLLICFVFLSDVHQ